MPVRKRRGAKAVTEGGSKWSVIRDYHGRTINKSEVDRGGGAGEGAVVVEELNVGHTRTEHVTH